MLQFDHNQLVVARKADLFDFLIRNHSERFKIEGSSIRLKENHSLSIKRGYCGFLDFATGDKGNSVDFLVNYMGYSLDEAVFALCGETTPSDHEQRAAVPNVEKLPPVFPEPTQGSYRNLYAYLLKRGISKDTIQMLIDQKLIYQTKDKNNIVFANKERDWGEIHGTYDKDGKSFHGIVPNCRHDGFWWFKTGDHPMAVFVCEAAIDAISLYEIHRKDKMAKPVVYASIGGVMKQSSIDRIKKHIKTILSVDNDEAGSECRSRNPELDFILPSYKDWNEDLCISLSLE